MSDESEDSAQQNPGGAVSRMRLLLNVVLFGPILLGVGLVLFWAYWVTPQFREAEMVLSAVTAVESGDPSSSFSDVLRVVSDFDAAPVQGDYFLAQVQNANGDLARVNRTLTSFGMIGSNVGEQLDDFRSSFPGVAAAIDAGESPLYLYTAEGEDLPSRLFAANLRIDSLNGELETLQASCDGAVETPLIDHCPEAGIARRGPVRVYFNAGEDRLGTLAQSELTDWIRSLPADEDLQIQVAGFADRVGDKDDNQLLSERRAQNVASFIRSERPEANVNATGNGERGLPIRTDDGVGEVYNRTVEVALM